MKFKNITILLHKFAAGSKIKLKNKLTLSEFLKKSST